LFKTSLLRVIPSKLSRPWILASMPSCFGRLRLVALGARGWGFAWPGAGALGHPAFAQCQARQAPEQEAADPDGVVHGEHRPLQGRQPRRLADRHGHAFELLSSGARGPIPRPGAARLRCGAANQGLLALPNRAGVSRLQPALLLWQSRFGLEPIRRQPWQWLERGALAGASVLRALLHFTTG